MATRGTIAVQREDGTVSQVYSHSDNYLDGTGQLLLDCYNNLQLAEELVLLGDISSVGKDVNRTKYYGRDYGEEGIESNVFTSLDHYYKHMRCEEYNYLFAHGQWSVEYCDSNGDFVFLSEVV